MLPPIPCSKKNFRSIQAGRCTFACISVLIICILFPVSALAACSYSFSCLKNYQCRADSLRYPDSARAAGLSPDSLQKVAAIMQQAIADSTFPGGVVGIEKDGQLAYTHAAGYFTYQKNRAVQVDDVYDLASLTKIIATTPSIMKLIDEHQIHLSDHLSKYFPEFRHGARRQITIRQLLLHTSGLPAYRIYVDSLKTRKEIVKAVKNEPLINPPGSKYLYSDLGFILLGRIVQKVSGLRLDTFSQLNFYRPLGMNSTYFNITLVGPDSIDKVAPTEKDTTFRRKLLRGQVDDPRAWYMYGVAGHAGLFSNVHDLAIFAQMLLNDGTCHGKCYLKSRTIKKFTRRQTKLINHGYGFDRKSGEASTAGSLTSPQTYGHLGFTGTSLWIDPKNNIAIILLSDRVYPHRSYGENINRVRAKIADAVMSSIIPK